MSNIEDSVIMYPVMRSQEPGCIYDFSAAEKKILAENLVSVDITFDSITDQAAKSMQEEIDKMVIEELIKLTRKYQCADEAASDAVRNMIFPKA